MSRLIKQVLASIAIFCCFSMQAQIVSVDKVTVTVSDVDAIKSFYTGLFHAKEVASCTYTGKGIAQLYNLKDTNTIVKTVELEIGNEVLELQSFKGKDNPQWQENDNLFEGIDHTAIGVSNTDEQYKFYRDLLGMTIGGHSENYGTEQEHLNQVFGARLWITGMKAPNGVGVEFLQYAAPPGGRKYPIDSKVTDIWHWSTTLKVDNIETVYSHCKASAFTVVSKGLLHCNLKGTSYTKAFMARDFDGHAVLITN